MPPSTVHCQPPPDSDDDLETGFFGSNKKDSARSQPATSITTSLQGKALTAHIIQYLQTAIGPHIVRRQSPYMKDSGLNTIGIRVTSLVLTLGQAKPPTLFDEQFLKPVPLQTVGQRVERSAPKDHEWLPLGSDGLVDSRYGEAYHVVHFLNTLLIDEQRIDGSLYTQGPPVLSSYTRWRA